MLFNVQDDARGLAMTCRATLVGALMMLSCSAASAQPCNPVIDGTYCATQGGEISSLPGVRSGSSYQPPTIRNDFLSPGEVPVATFGAISFQGNGTRCMGLFNRGNCK